MDQSENSELEKFTKGQFKYDIETTSATDFKIVLTYKAENSLITSALKKSMRKLNKNPQGINVNYIERFELDDKLKPTMIPVLNKAIRNNINSVFKVFREYGFNVVSWGVDNAVYTNMGACWLIDIIVRGIYAKR